MAVLEDAGYAAVAHTGENSQFDVVADGTLVFSKREEGRFPEPEELLARLA